VQRGERGQGVDLGNDVVVDQRRLDETISPVDDAVPDGLRRLVGFDRTRRFAFDDMALQARGARVDR
jgi:hypothetical protein